MEMIELYAEYGAVGVIVLMFVGQMIYVQKSLTTKLNEIEEICIKLIDRWNNSDEVRDRRHDTMVGELNDLSDDIKEMKGLVRK